MRVELVTLNQAKQFVDQEMISSLGLVHIDGFDGAVINRVAKAKDLGRWVL
jgi:hypothetical protein